MSTRPSHLKRMTIAALMLTVLYSGTATADLEPSARFLVIVFDAVPYEAAVDFQNGSQEHPPVLEDMQGPVPLVSSFPSNTSVALTAILNDFGTELPPGYENKFFDRERNKIRGGTLGSYSKIRFDWHHFFDWQLQGFFKKSKSYAKPIKYMRREVDKAMEAFLASDKRAFFVYVNSTDGTGHTHGPEALRLAFENLEVRLQEIRERSTVPIYTIVLSDHGLAGGGEVLENSLKSVRRGLKSADWKPKKKLGKSDWIVLTPFGLVSSFEVYTPEGEEASVTETVVAQQGVDLCAYPEGEGWVVANQEGRAEFSFREQLGERQWSYRPQTADPLHYAAAVDSLRTATGRSDWFADEDWLGATWTLNYPDALHRIASGFELVRNPASILCSVDEGYLYGSKSAMFGSKFSVGRVRWTHGALGKDATLGFLMTDFPGWDSSGPVRFDDALDFLAVYLREETSQ